MIERLDTTEYARRVDKQITLALVLLAGCWKDTAACTASAGDLVSYLRSMEHEPSVVPDDAFTRLHVPMHADMHTAVPQAPLVIVSPKEITVQGQLLTLEELAPRLAATNQTIREQIAKGQVPKGFVEQLDLLIDGDVSWGQVAAIAQTASASGFDQLAFIFTRAATTPVPPSRGPSDTVADVEDLSKLVRSCHAVGKLLGDLASVEPGAKAQMLIDGIGPALVDCRCAVDMAALRALWKLIGQPNPQTALVLTLARDARPIDLPATMLWREASTHLAPKIQTWLEAP